VGLQVRDELWRGAGAGADGEEGLWQSAIPG
jgi:hypothetical protein